MGTGHYSVVPPSSYVAKKEKPADTLAWMPRYGVPAVVDAADLRRLVVLVAVTALLARHWPAQESARRGRVGRGVSREARGGPVGRRDRRGTGDEDCGRRRSGEARRLRHRHGGEARR